MQKKPSDTIINFHNAQITHKIKESISAYKLDTKLGTGTYNLPNVSELSKLEVTHDNIPQMKQLCKKLTDIQREFVQGIEYTISNTTTNKTVRDTVVKDKLSKAEPFTRALTQFDNKIDAKRKEGLNALPRIKTLKETEYDELAKMPKLPTLAEELAKMPNNYNTIEPINHNTIKVDLPTIHPINHNTINVDFAFNGNKSNFANNTVINNQGTKTIQDTARQPTQPTQHHKNKTACCTIF